MQKQFKITAYHSDFDFRNKRNGVVFTNIDDLLRFINKSRYYNATTGKQVEPTDEWHYCFKDALEGLELIRHWAVDEKPTDHTLRIIGVSIFHALPQTTDVNVYDSLDDVRLANIPADTMYLYPYTMEEFINALRTYTDRTDNRGRMTSSCQLPHNEYDFIALRKS